MSCSPQAKSSNHIRHALQIKGAAKYLAGKVTTGKFVIHVGVLICRTMALYVL